MAAEVVVVSCGMMTPVGLSAPEVAASARSRIQRLGEIEWRDRRLRRYVVSRVPDDGLPDPDPSAALLPSRSIRMLRLAVGPLAEALGPLPKGAGKVPLMLGLPERQTAIPIDGPDLLKRWAAEFPIDEAESGLFPHGRGSALLALHAAFDKLAAGKARFCLVGGLDCQVDLHLMAGLDLEGRIRNEMNPDGFAPGEGAGFLLLTTAAMAERHRLLPLVRVAACASGSEKGHLYSDDPYKGDGLAETFTKLFEGADGLAPVGCVYCGFNGERYWGKEFGVAMLRNRPKFDADHQMEHPAECFGDLGAAHGAVMLGLAALGVDEGYRRDPTLIYGSSDRGARAAALFTRPTPKS